MHEASARIDARVAATSWTEERYAVLEDLRHSLGSRLLYVWMRDHTGRRDGRLTASIQMMARALGISRQAVDCAETTGQGLPKGAYHRLVALGLVEEVARDADGTITFYVLGLSAKNPRAVRPDPQTDFGFAQSRGAATESHAERDLKSADEPTSPTVPIGRPASSVGAPLATSLQRSCEPGAITIEEYKKLNHDHKPCSLEHGVLEDQGGSQLRGDEVARAARELISAVPDPARILAAKQALVDLIEQKIGTAGTDPSQPWIAAEAVVEHGVPLGELHKTIHFAKRQDDAGKARAGLRGCFYGSFKRVCGRHGFDWPRKPKPK